MIKNIKINRKKIVIAGILIVLIALLIIPIIVIMILFVDGLKENAIDKRLWNMKVKKSA